MLTRVLLLAPLALHLAQPLNSIAESWLHYGFVLPLGPVKVAFTGITTAEAPAAAEPVAAAAIADTSPLIEKGDTIAGFPVTSGFGPRESPCPGCSSLHGGVDLGTPTGTPLYAPAPAEVRCWNDDGGGLVADIWIGPELYKALHLDTCTDGNYAAGEKFAETGASGRGTGPHLDWRQKVDGQWVQPRKGMVEAALTGVPLGSEVAEDPGDR